ncbi:hypothetical protein LCGC14_0434890 [marine sediment metagenome]|uniref:Terminase large subunit gp17-like C-terminal domain-containing protein n=1 Tax=marine sediment metagenome TaxID=412755 RepID=A0A0F9T549_9ZZZZ
MLRLRQSINDKIAKYEKVIKQCLVDGKDRDAVLLDRDMKRWRCRNDLYYLAKITGENSDKITKYKSFYEPFCDKVSLQTWQVIRLELHKNNEDLLPIDKVADERDFKYIQRLFLCYRTYYKTTIITKFHSLQLLLNFNNIHIVLCHDVENIASDNLVAIKNYFLTTEVGKLFPECIPKGKEWGNMSGFSLANRTDWGISEENIEARGKASNITGGHWQIAKKNDLENENSVNTKEQLEKTKKWDDQFNLGNFHDPKTPLQDYEGTIYHFSDLYMNKKGNPDIEVIEIPLLKDQNPNNITVENITHPERFSVEDIEFIKRDKGIWRFMCQMLLKPEDPARMQFKIDMLSYYSSIPKGSIFYELVDPASARKKKSDYTVMLIVGLGYFDGILKKFIADGVRDKLNPKQRIDLSIDLAKKWSIRGCGWEAIAFQETDCYYLEEARRKARLYYTITEIKSHKASKEDRIRGLVPEYSNHEWLWPEKGKIVKTSIFDGKSYDLTEELEYELRQFPLAEHDDLMDTQTFFNRISTIKPEQVKQDNESQGMTFGDYAKLKEDRIAEENKDPWARFTVGSRI